MSLINGDKPKTKDDEIMQKQIKAIEKKKFIIDIPSM